LALEKDFQVGPWLVQPSSNSLLRGGKAIHVEPKVMEVLVGLAKSAGETVTKEELIHTIWPDVFVTDDVLTRSISELRRAFEDDARNPRVIQTISKRGYRLIAPVAPADHNNAHHPLANRGTGTAAAPASAGTNRLRFLAVTTMGLALLFALLLTEYQTNWIRNRIGSHAAPQIRSLAVLPLQNLSGDPNQDYFADGMTDALITDLAQIGSLKVISRSSTIQYNNSEKSLPTIARELNVEGIVEGTVQRSGDRVRITTQLIHGPTDTHIWAKSYEHDAKDFFALEREVAEAIAGEIRVTLTPGEKARLARSHSVSLESLQAYLQGQYHLGLAQGMSYQKGLQQAEMKELATARQFFEQALRDDPEYAQAYVDLARSWRDRPFSEKGPQIADEMLHKALQIDPELAEAHEQLATLDVLRQWKWTEAEAEYIRAIELNPNFAEAHARYAEYLDMMGRLDEGMKEFLRTQELDPGHNFQPNPFYRRRQYDRAIEIDKNEVRRQAFGFWAHMDLAFDYDGAGRHDEAAQEWESMMRMLGYSDLADAMHRGLLKSGYRGSFKILTEALEAQNANGSPPPAFFMAMMYGLLGEKNRAFWWLEKGYQQRDPAYSALNVDPCWDPLRDDPRFASLVRRVGLPH
jgi:TolB-like protein/DNA-binding winged helix-turn-helix (wHTH) protein